VPAIVDSSIEAIPKECAHSIGRVGWLFNFKTLWANSDEFNFLGWLHRTTTRRVAEATPLAESYIAFVEQVLSLE
jgi:hypothetical protein